MNMAKIIQITRKIELETSGQIFDTSSTLDSIILADKQILSDQLNLLFNHDLKFEGKISNFDSDEDFKHIPTNAVKKLVSGAENVPVNLEFEQALNKFMVAALAVVSLCKIDIFLTILGNQL